MRITVRVEGPVGVEILICEATWQPEWGRDNATINLMPTVGSHMSLGARVTSRQPADAPTEVHAVLKTDKVANAKAYIRRLKAVGYRVV